MTMGTMALNALHGWREQQHADKHFDLEFMQEMRQYLRRPDGNMRLHFPRKPCRS